MTSTSTLQRSITSRFSISSWRSRSSRSRSFIWICRKCCLPALLIILAVWKAALVAMHFMHLKFEKKTLAVVALSPFVLCVFLILMLMPDIFPH